MNVDALQETDYSVVSGTVFAQCVNLMAYREFLDSAGVPWTVWDTYPTRPGGMDPKWRDGWLTFQSGTTRRRLAPVPKDWTDASLSRLELMCKAADPSLRETPPFGNESSPGE